MPTPTAVEITLSDDERSVLEGASRPMVTKWRNRFAEHRLPGLLDEPRPGRPRTITDEQVERVVIATLETKPKDAAHWSTRSMAAQAGPGSCPRTGSSSRRSTRSAACTSTRPSGRSCWRLRRRARSRRRTAPRRRCRCFPAHPSARRMTISAMAPLASTLRSTCSPTRS